jgi:hypothetical protein
LTNLVLNPHLNLHTQQVSAVDSSLFIRRLRLFLPITLQPSVAVGEFSSVSTFQCLHEIAQHGVVMLLVIQLSSNYGYNCPVLYSIADRLFATSCLEAIVVVAF